MLFEQKWLPKDKPKYKGVSKGRKHFHIIFAPSLALLAINVEPILYAKDQKRKQEITYPRPMEFEQT